jgi:exosortase E/protease (VPEID-CTERM system)
MERAVGLLPRISGSDVHAEDTAAAVSRRTDRSLLARGAFVAAILLAEGIFLGIRFEGPAPGTEWWAIFLSQVSTIVRFGIAGAAASILLGGQQIRERIRLAAAVSSTRRRLWPLLAAHAVLFVGFFRLTTFVIEGDLHASSTPGLWVAAWLGLGLVTVTLAVAVALPASGMLRLARGLSGLALVGIVVGGGAIAAGQLTSKAWRPLGRVTLSVVNAVMSRIAFDPLVDRTQMIVGTQRFNVEIAAQCSGYEGIGLMCVFLVAYLWSCRASLRLPHALLLIPIGTLVAWVLNAARIVGLIAVGTWLSPEVALGGFHSYSGWLLFCGGALGLVAVARRSPFFTRPDVLHDAAATANPTGVYICPLLALVVAGMVAGAFTAGGFDALYALRVAAVASVLWWFRKDYRRLRWTWSWGAIAAGTGVFIMWMALEVTHVPTGREGALRAGLMALPAGWAGAWLSLRVIGSVLTVPIAEELAFRGYLLRRLIAVDFDSVSLRQFSWIALLGSSLVFGAMHDRLLAGTLAGVVYALAAQRRGELSDAVVAHATTNALLAAYALATGTWSLWT